MFPVLQSLGGDVFHRWLSFHNTKTNWWIHCSAHPMKAKHQSAPANYNLVVPYIHLLIHTYMLQQLTEFPLLAKSYRESECVREVISAFQYLHGPSIKKIISSLPSFLLFPPSSFCTWYWEFTDFPWFNFTVWTFYVHKLVEEQLSPQNMPRGYIVYFKLVIFKEQQRQEKFQKLSSSYHSVRNIYIYNGNLHF